MAAAMWQLIKTISRIRAMKKHSGYKNVKNIKKATQILTSPATPVTSGVKTKSPRRHFEL